jgi:hypothetical protein
MNFVDNFRKKVMSGNMTLSDVQDYVLASGLALDNIVYDDFSFLASGMSVEEVYATKSRSRELTNVGVGGELRLISWLVSEALSSAETARLGINRRRANNLHTYAKNLIIFAEAEMRRMFPDTTMNLDEYRQEVYKPLPEDGWMLDE